MLTMNKFMFVHYPQPLQTLPLRNQLILWPALSLELLNWLCACRNLSPQGFIININMSYTVTAFSQTSKFGGISVRRLVALPFPLWWKKYVKRISKSKDCSRVNFCIHSSRERPLYNTMLYKNFKRLWSVCCNVYIEWNLQEFCNSQLAKVRTGQSSPPRV